MFEIWMDPETMTKYKVEVVRDFKKMKEVGGKSI